MRKLQVLVDAILVNMNDDFQALYSRRGRPSIAPERLLRANLIQTLFSIQPNETAGGLRMARFIGLAKVRAQTTFTFAACKLTRMATIFGWRLSAVVGSLRPRQVESAKKCQKSA